VSAAAPKSDLHTLSKFCTTLATKQKKINGSSQPANKQRCKQTNKQTKKQTNTKINKQTRQETNSD